MAEQHLVPLGNNQIIKVEISDEASRIIDRDPLLKAIRYVAQVALKQGAQVIAAFIDTINAIELDVQVWYRVRQEQRKTVVPLRTLLEQADTLLTTLDEFEGRGGMVGEFKEHMRKLMMDKIEQRVEKLIAECFVV